MTKTELTYLFDMLTLVIEGYGDEVTHEEDLEMPCGLCVFIDDLYGECVSMVKIERQWHDWMESWDEFSGNILYPVPAGNDPQGAYNCAQDYGWLYDTDTEYGKARIRLAEHLRECVLKELEK